MRIRPADARLARIQAQWIVALEPWRSLGYEEATLSKWLSRSAREHRVFVLAREQVQGVIVVQPDVLLGSFIALVAVRPEMAGQGVGRALVEHVARKTFAKRRWLYVSSDSRNEDAARFYKKLGFSRVGKLPDLIRAKRTELLWRKERP